MGPWVVPCWTCCVEGVVVGAKVLGATVFGYCVEGHNVGAVMLGTAVRAVLMYHLYSYILLSVMFSLFPRSKTLQHYYVITIPTHT